MRRACIIVWIVLLGACGIVDPSDRSGIEDGPAFEESDAGTPDASLDAGPDGSADAGP